MIDGESHQSVLAALGGASIFSGRVCFLGGAVAHPPLLSCPSHASPVAPGPPLALLPTSPIPPPCKRGQRSSAGWRKRNQTARPWKPHSCHAMPSRADGWPSKAARLGTPCLNHPNDHNNTTWHGPHAQSGDPLDPMYGMQVPSILVPRGTMAQFVTGMPCIACIEAA